MRELRDAGYLVTEKIQDPETGRWSTVTTVYEEPLATAAVTVIPPLCMPFAAHLARQMVDASRTEAAEDQPEAETTEAPEVEDTPQAVEAAAPLVLVDVESRPVRQAQVKALAAKKPSAVRRLSDDPERLAKARELIASGLPYRAVGRELGCDPKTLRRWRDQGLIPAA
ncbi:helix-turn-helix domain containing protein [Rhodococcus triatomae]|nr:hypothetical protein G419_25412 [Rhodococcus triatomae BKS 15-14]